MVCVKKCEGRGAIPFGSWWEARCLRSTSGVLKAVLELLEGPAMACSNVRCWNLLALRCAVLRIEHSSAAISVQGFSSVCFCWEKAEIMPWPPWVNMYHFLYFDSTCTSCHLSARKVLGDSSGESQGNAHGNMLMWGCSFFFFNPLC